ncbi:rCG24405 [Rattus norvegicus]|uniref:RCG24405 n=1 Tax=Rattus norvegicus TaxID=10116 RepID=A6K595_RAT|nr:rCG24405 [Rattus norvegicus]
MCVLTRSTSTSPTTESIVFSLTSLTRLQTISCTANMYFVLSPSFPSFLHSCHCSLNSPFEASGSFLSLVLLLPSVTVLFRLN